MRKLAWTLVLVILLVSGVAAPVQADSNLAEAVSRAVLWLHGQQKVDGGFGAGTQSSAAMTADVVYVLGLLGEDVDGPAWTTAGGKSALDALQALSLPTYATSDPGQAGKVARAVAAAGADPRQFGGVDLVVTIEKFYDPTTGRYHKDFLFRHTLAMEGLLRSGEHVPQGAYDALISAQLADGGWFWAFSGAKADVDTTGRVLQILGRESQDGCDIGLLRAADYLARLQMITGGWAVDAPPTKSLVNANSTALAVGGLRAIGHDPDAAPYVKSGHSGLQALLSFQEASGAFVYASAPGNEEVRLTATTDALIGLLQPVGASKTSCPKVYLPLVLVP
jgi:hypothetical protein